VFVCKSYVAETLLTLSAIVADDIRYKQNILTKIITNIDAIHKLCNTSTQHALKLVKPWLTPWLRHDCLLYDIRNNYFDDYNM